MYRNTYLKDLSRNKCSWDPKWMDKKFVCLFFLSMYNFKLLGIRENSYNSSTSWFKLFCERNCMLPTAWLKYGSQIIDKYFIQYVSTLNIILLLVYIYVIKYLQKQFKWPIFIQGIQKYTQVFNSAHVHIGIK